MRQSLGIAFFVLQLPCRISFAADVIKCIYLIAQSKAIAGFLAVKFSRISRYRILSEVYMLKTKKPVSKPKAAAAVKTPAVKDAPTLTEVKQLYKFMQDNNLGTIDYEQKGTRIKLVRLAPVQVAVPVAVGGGNAVAQSDAPAAPQYAQTIKSPLMGIFFRGSSPSAPPFIREGEKVKAGTPICLIEAMKVFNEVKAPNDCIIKKVLVENGQPVKPGDLLFAIEKI